MACNAYGIVKWNYPAIDGIRETSPAQSRIAFPEELKRLVREKLPAQEEKNVYFCAFDSSSNTAINRDRLKEYTDFFLGIRYANKWSVYCLDAEKIERSPSAERINISGNESYESYYKRFCKDGKQPFCEYQIRSEGGDGQ